MCRELENTKLHRVLDELGFCDGSLRLEQRAIEIHDKKDGGVTIYVARVYDAIYGKDIAISLIYDDNRGEFLSRDEMSLGEFILRFFK